MWNVSVVWDDDNSEHIAEHDLTADEVEEVLLNESNPTAASQSTGRPCRFGWTSTGKHIIVVWDELCDDPEMIYPVTAYETPPES